MSATIWKYELKTTDEQSLDLPIGGKILTVQVQYEIPCIWVLVDPREKKEKRHIKIFGTGHPIEGGNMRYIGTYQLQKGSLVFHVVESIQT